MRGSSSGAPKRRSTYERMCDLLGDWDALFAELGAQVAGRTTRVRSTFARTAARFAPRRHEAERELAAFREAPVGDRRRRAPELERTMAELRDLVVAARAPIEGP
jgi:chromosome condensin MukBEF ATPase and DNA-binding subunit MukB